MPDATAPLGSTERTNQLLGGNYFNTNTGAPIPPPTSNPGTPVLGSQPAYTPDTSGASALSASTQAIIDAETKRASDALSAENAAKSTAAANPPIKSMADYLSQTGKEAPAQYQADQFKAIGVDPTTYFTGLKADTDALNALQKDLNDTIAQRDAQISNITGVPGQSIDFLNNQVAQINRNANVVISQKTANLNAQAALIQMKQGNFQEAQNFVKSAVDAYTSGISADLKLFQDFQQNNQDLITGLDKTYQDAITSAQKATEDQLKQTTDEKDKVGNLMLQYPNAGISLSDTLGQAQSKASLVAGNKTQIIGSSDTGYSILTTDKSGKVVSNNPVSGNGGGSSNGVFTQTQLNKGAANAGISMDDFGKLDTDSKNYFINSLTQLNAFKKLGSRQAMLDAINSSTSAPQGVKDILTKYVDSKYPAPKQSTSNFKWYNPLTWF